MRCMCLHFIPHYKIDRIFDRLREESKAINLELRERDQIDKFMSYMENQWIRNSFWTKSRWSVFMQVVRTKNEFEGWHFRINGRAHVSGMNFYELVPLLHDEADDIPMERERVCQKKGSRRVRREFREMQEMLKGAWDFYNEEEDSAWDLLVGLADLYIGKTQLRFDADLDYDRADENDDDDDD